MENMVDTSTISVRREMRGTGLMDKSMMDMPKMMAMYFHNTVTEYILFKECYTKNAGAMAGACMIAVMMGILYEGLKYVQEKSALVSSKVAAVETMETFEMATPIEGTQCKDGQQSTISESPTHRNKMQVSRHLWRTAVYTLQVMLRYCLMLIAMTFNIWLYLAVALGAAIGFFFIGWRRTLVTSSTFSDAECKRRTAENC